MRYFYEMYPDAVIFPQVEDELITDANRPQVGDDLQMVKRCFTKLLRNGFV